MTVFNNSYDAIIQLSFNRFRVVRGQLDKAHALLEIPQNSHHALQPGLQFGRVLEFAEFYPHVLKCYLDKGKLVVQAVGSFYPSLGFIALFFLADFLEKSLLLCDIRTESLKKEKM